MPYVPTMGAGSGSGGGGGVGGSQSAASSSSSPSSSTLSLQMNPRHHLYRNNSLHGNPSRPISSMTSVYQTLYSSMSTFWPYRLLICIMDQRDIAGPILDELCIDILRFVGK